MVYQSVGSWPLEIHHDTPWLVDFRQVQIQVDSIGAMTHLPEDAFSGHHVRLPPRIPVVQGKTRKLNGDKCKSHRICETQHVKSRLLEVC